MKLQDVLNEIKMDSQEYLQESVVKKGKKYYAMKNGSKEQILSGTKEDGYLSLENAVKAMLSSTTPDFSRLPFQKKQERIDRYIKQWKTKNNVKDPKPKKKYGFEVMD